MISLVSPEVLYEASGTLLLIHVIFGPGHDACVVDVHAILAKEVVLLLNEYFRSFLLDGIAV